MTTVLHASNDITVAAIRLRDRLPADSTTTGCPILRYRRSSAG
ncbi:hypothetical protein ACFQ16_15220 [Saccharopolyspora rosea]|uniref:Uncharacterized protein n=1 Tax=Saccharopolyspora rosea TaxID=524884 RepID=A0ABW3FW35_9PSEU